MAGTRALDFGCGGARLALPFSETCEFVYGLDVDPAVLEVADAAAKQLGRSNLAWLESTRLAELNGAYDLVFSINVFQHIPSREGERLLAALVSGLRPGGVAAIQIVLKPTLAPKRLFDRSFMYLWNNSYSLNRLARVLADNGVWDFHVVQRRYGARYGDSLLLFTKP